MGEGGPARDDQRSKYNDMFSETRAASLLAELGRGWRESAGLRGSPERLSCPSRRVEEVGWW